VKCSRCVQSTGKSRKERKEKSAKLAGSQVMSELRFPDPELLRYMSKKLREIIDEKKLRKLNEFAAKFSDLPAFREALLS
jgi:hypothetical protein